VPVGVACGPDPGSPDSILTGPKLTLPSDCSQVRCRARSTQAVAAAGQSWWSSAVSTSGVSSAGSCATTGWPTPIRAGAAYAQAVPGEDAATAGPTSPVSRAVALPPAADAATAAATAVAATAPAASAVSAVRLSRLPGCHPVPFMRSLRPRLVILPCPSCYQR